jgi:hypothetical protein
MEAIDVKVNPLNPELNPICHLLALLKVHHFLHISRISVKLLTLRLLMSYIYIYGAARLLSSWVRIPPGHGYLSVVCVVCCQVEVSATN